MKKNLTWQVGHSNSLAEKPQETVPAIVPGAVQADWAAAKNWPDHNYGLNFKEYGWMEDKYWTYSAKVEKPDVSANQRVFFVCGGVDYQYMVKLNGEKLYEYEGMFTPFELDITDKLNGNDEIELIVFPAPKNRKEEAGTRAEANLSAKPPYSYGWDWHPRLIPLGIWKDTYVEVRNAAFIKDAELFYTLNETLDAAEITVAVETSQPAQIKWMLKDKNGKIVASGTRGNHTLKNPELWWPNGQGEPTLYTSTVEIYDESGNLLDTKNQKVGFRRTKLVMYDGQWNVPMTFPMSRNEPPFTLEINCRKIFAKGSNWVPPDIFPGKMTRDDYFPHVEYAKNANFNILRIWGGGVNNKEDFFELCDEMGIMLWSEFPLACNEYVDDEHYLSVLDLESKSLIKHLRRYASVVMWSGGNELFNNWSRMTDQSLALRLLHRNCFDMDRDTPFIMTSPIMGVGHGGYMFRYFQTGEEVFQVMPKSNRTAYTEFGCGGPSPVEYLKSFIPEDELFPPKPSGVWEAHHAYNAWVGEDTWLNVPMIEEYFGKIDSLEELVRCGEILQCQGYKCIYEEARRQKPRCSMALNWCYNEPWPTAAGNSLLTWPCEAKPAYYAVAESCRPVLASARIPKFSWAAGEEFTAELWLLNDKYEEIPAGKMTAYLKIDGVEYEMGAWEFEIVAANKNLQGPTVSYKMPKASGREFELVLRVDGFPAFDSAYTFVQI